MTEAIIFVDADYLNFLAFADATFDPAGLRTPSLDALLQRSEPIYITQTVLQESTRDTSFAKDFVLDIWVGRNRASGDIEVPFTPERPGAGGRTFDGRTLGGGEASIQNFILREFGASERVDILTNNAKDYFIDDMFTGTQVSLPFNSLNDMIANGHITLDQYDALAQRNWRSGHSTIVPASSTKARVRPSNMERSG